MTEKELVGKLAVQMRRHREQLGLTIEACAHEVGIHADYLAHLERATKTPSFAMLIKIATVLGISPLELFRSRHEALEPDQKLQAIVRGLPDDQKQDLFAVIAKLRRTRKIKTLRALLDA